MKNILAAANKILLIGCVVSALLCGAVFVWHFGNPNADFEEELAKADAMQENVNQTILKQTEEKQQEVESLRALLVEQQAKLEELESAKAAADTEYAAAEEELENLNALPQRVLDLRKEYGEKIRELEEKIQAGESSTKICYLTFDDGPNNLTADILKKLDELDAYATFFTISANSAPGQKENLRAEMMAGHSVGNHTYDHVTSWSLIDGFEKFKEQVMLQDERVYKDTGFHMDMFRFPGGSVGCHFKELAEPWLEEQGYKWIDWTASAWDAGQSSGLSSADAILITAKDKDIVVVLAHDFNYSTYLGIEKVVTTMREEGYIFLPLFTQSVMFDEPLDAV